MRTLHVQRLLALLACCAAGLGTQAGAQTNEFLDPEEAFQVTAELSDTGELQVHWAIADDYYMYRDRMALRVVAPAEAQVGELVLPEGTVKDDPYFGRMEVYYQAVTGRASVALAGDAPAALTVEVDHQGCAENGICYPPTTTELTVPLTQATAPGYALGRENLRLVGERHAAQFLGHLHQVRGGL